MKNLVAAFIAAFLSVGAPLWAQTLRHNYGLESYQYLPGPNPIQIEIVVPQRRGVQNASELLRAALAQKPVVYSPASSVEELYGALLLNKQKADNDLALLREKARLEAEAEAAREAKTEAAKIALMREQAELIKQQRLLVEEQRRALQRQHNQ
ncbi:MAG: hypothetical protein LBS31_12055 [Candidatus Adiutrix sp.]|jgi:hypothetical protein|nr:hypothetical protein [Candidatus Adiutrix sp.]